MVARKGGLSAEELAGLAEALASGKRATVYLRDPVAGLGLEEGTSARVISVDGNTVTVRPRGVDDDLPYEADELRRTRSESEAPKARKTAAMPAKRTPATPKPAVPKPAVPKPAAQKPAATQPVAQAPAPAVKPRSTRPASASEAEGALRLFGAGGAEETAATASPVAAPAPKPADALQQEEPAQESGTPVGEPASAPTVRARPARARSSSATPTVRITITGTAGDSWTVAVARGSTKVGEDAEVAPGAVLRSVRELGHEAAFLAVQESLASTREAAARRIAELTRELDEAKAVFDSLG